MGSPAAKPAAVVESELVAVAADDKLKVGDKPKAKWGNRWWDVEVMSVQDDGKVKIHWVGWSSSWDESRARNTLFRAAKPTESPATSTEQTKSSDGEK